MFFFGTHHAFEDGDLPGTLRDYVVTDCLSALHQRLLGVGSPDVRWPSDTGQQTWGATNRVVTGTGGLLVPGFNWIAGDEQRHSNAHHSEPGWFLHVWNRLGTFYAELFSSAVRLFCLVFRKLSAAYIGWLGDVIVTQVVRQIRAMRWADDDPSSKGEKKHPNWSALDGLMAPLECVCVCMWYS